MNAAMKLPLRSHLLRLAAALAAGAALAGVFLAYQDPHLMRRLADMVWACF